jgi:hypothetical protein
LFVRTSTFASISLIIWDKCLNDAYTGFPPISTTVTTMFASTVVAWAVAPTVVANPPILKNATHVIHP